MTDFDDNLVDDETFSINHDKVSVQKCTQLKGVKFTAKSNEHLLPINKMGSIGRIDNNQNQVILLRRDKYSKNDKLRTHQDYCLSVESQNLKDVEFNSSGEQSQKHNNNGILNRLINACKLGENDGLMINRRHNQSDFLPNINKINPKTMIRNSNRNMSYLNKERTVKLKHLYLRNQSFKKKKAVVSTIKSGNYNQSNILTLNQSLIESVYYFQVSLRKLSKNKLIINQQKNEKCLLNRQIEKLLNYKYQYNIDKQISKLIQTIAQMKTKIKEKKIKFKKKQKNALKNMVRKNSSQQQHTPIKIIRQQYLHIRREQLVNQQRLESLDNKIKQYQSMLQEIERKEHLQSYWDLIRRKIFLHFDIDKINEDFTVNISELESTNQLLRRQISEKQVQIISIQKMRKQGKNTQKVKSQQSVSQFDNPELFNLEHKNDIIVEEKTAKNNVTPSRQKNRRNYRFFSEFQ